MSNQIECLRCHEMVDKGQLHTCQTSKSQVCKSCASIIKHDNAMETKRHRKATLKKRMEEQEYYRSSKAKALGDAIMSAHKTPILTKLSKSPRAATTRECRSKLADIALAREYGIEVSDML